MKKKNKALEIIIDFDGTCVTHDYPRIGKEIGAVPVLKALVSNGHRLILSTMRNNGMTSTMTGHEFDGLAEAVEWFKINDIPLYGVQTNPTQYHWTNSPKAYGQLLIDDIGLGVPTKFDKTMSDRKYVDWVRVKQWLIKNDLI